MKYLTIALAIVVVVLLLLMCEDKNGCPDYIYEGSTTDTLYVSDTLIRNINVLDKVYVSEYKVLKEFDTTGNKLVDSLLSVINTLRQYNDTLSNDTLDIFLKESIFQNKRNDLILSYRLKIPFTTVVNNTTLISEKNNEYYLGGSFIYTNKIFIGPSISFKDKNSNLFTGSLLLSPKARTGFMIQYSKQLNFQKRNRLMNLFKLAS